MLVLLATAASAACGGGAATCALGTMADTAGWQVFDAGPFVFKLPPGYRDEHPIGTDSYVGMWKHGERTVLFTWGPHTADPRDAPGGSRSPYCQTRIGGWEALVEDLRVPGPGGPSYHLGGWWERPDTMGAHLYVAATGPADDANGRAIASTILRTVRLRTVWSDDDRRRFTWRLCEISRANEAGSRIQPAEPAADPRGCPTVRPPPAAYDRVR